LLITELTRGTAMSVKRSVFRTYILRAAASAAESRVADGEGERLRSPVPIKRDSIQPSQRVSRGGWGRYFGPRQALTQTPQMCCWKSMPLLSARASRLFFYTENEKPEIHAA
jgi:hypothetical protein